MEQEQVQLDPQNREQQLAYELVAHTNSSFFLTGRAGTGKTKFLHNIQKLTNKKFVILAPTGIAAILAGGETIHSFFGIPLGVCDEDTLVNMNQTHILTLIHADTVIIDEVSMVRCDLLDVVDVTMRRCLRNNQPFGGKQMVFVGDMFQLPPVVTNNDKEILTKLYPDNSFFFFKSKAVKRMNLPRIEFQKVYRQDDIHFLQTLENVRLNHITTEDMNRLNSRVSSAEKDNDMVVTLSPVNSVASSLNKQRLDEINAEEYVYEGELSGDFAEKDCVAEPCLHLKEGAQVMFVRNDPQKRWVNGTLGKVEKLSEEEIHVTLDSGETYQVPRFTWDSFSYDYDEVTQKVKKVVKGTFTQYPLRLAWAITVHKSQGMTFDRMKIDLSRGMFADGQLYVALSRVRSLNGLYLSRYVHPNYIRTNSEILAYASGYNNIHHINNEIESGKAVYGALKNNDYDEIAKQYLLLIEKKAKDGDIREAMQLSKRLLDILICDDHLYGCVHQISNELKCATHWAPKFLAALLCLYACEYGEALEAINQVLTCHDCPEALYVKSRALAKLGRYDESDMINCYLSDQMKESSIDLKVLYAGALINELHLNEPGLDIMQMVVKERPKYNRAIASYRMLVKRHNQRIEGVPGEKCELVNAFNSDMDDEDFISMLKAYRKDNAKAVACLINLIKKQK